MSVVFILNHINNLIDHEETYMTLLLVLILFRMGFLGAAHGCGGRGRAKRAPSLESVTHILQWWNLTQLYLAQRRSKKYMNHATHLLSLLTSAFFHRKSVNFAISRNTDIDCILIHISIYFNFSWVFIDCYNKHG